ncbi:hypothetical protein PHLGIDRAFT_292527 [Phlebiopsis gigantea 11061_1 CR5-6]|uniref:Fungal-type protein kinase domain-containing protein n=1 Tax=Phlebiopsis gigantea (strain 11061_1 CR5-6) TaxID=745531 RepID=A0A0C3RR56_PHLG1|nr:hypothetical protein PHLGIDRAFT_292527 [Phlebiopsis gigantea 11061_1 CR5-6]
MTMAMNTTNLSAPLLRLQVMAPITIPLNVRQSKTQPSALLWSPCSVCAPTSDRTSFFQLVLVNRWARFVYWDRSGAVVSTRFDYVHEPELLSQFSWRFTHISDEQQGMDVDPTATIASKVQVALFENAMGQFLDSMRAQSTAGAFTRYLPGAEDPLDSSGSYPTWKIHVINETSGKRSELIVRRPFAGHSSLFGRATRAYIAYDLRERRLVFMKDAWRIDNPKLRPEFNTYQSLQHHGIPHMPTVFYGGDVRGSDGEVQKTSAPSVGAGRG